MAKVFKLRGESGSGARDDASPWGRERVPVEKDDDRGEQSRGIERGNFKVAPGGGRAAVAAFERRA